MSVIYRMPLAPTIAIAMLVSVAVGALNDLGRVGREFKALQAGHPQAVSMRDRQPQVLRTIGGHVTPIRHELPTWTSALARAAATTNPDTAQSQRFDGHRAHLREPVGCLCIPMRRRLWTG